MQRFLSRPFFLLIFFTLVVGVCSSAFASNTLISVSGVKGLPNWNAYVHLPSDYSQHPDVYYPTILFFPGTGEVGTDPSKAIRFGPNAYIADGWNGEVTVDGQTTKFIVISLQPPSAFYGNMSDVKSRIADLVNKYRIDPNRVHFTGLSNGGWMSNMFATYKPSATDYSFIDFPASVVNIAGIVPADVFGATPPYPQRFTAYAQHGGKELGFEQTQDFRDIQTIIRTMNAAVQGSASYFSSTFDGGGHTAWWRFYGGKNYPLASSYQPETFFIDGIQQTIYQWMAQQTRGAAPSINIPPIANAGQDIVINLPISSAILLSGQKSIDTDGTIARYAWAQVSGPNTANIISPSAVSTEITGLAQAGTYVFALTVSDEGGAAGTDVVTVTVQALTPSNIPTPFDSGPDNEVVAVLPEVPRESSVTLSMTSEGKLEEDLSTLTIPPGGAVCIRAGDYYRGITLSGIHGTAEKPITIINCEGVVKASALFVTNSNNFVISGSGGSDQYGFILYGGTAIDSGIEIADTTTDYTIERVDIAHAKSGIALIPRISQNPTENYPLRTITNVTIKNVRISDVANGILIGATDRPSYAPYPARMNNVKIFSNFITRAQSTGISLSYARDGAEVYNNVVITAGTGIILGENTNGNVYNNIIDTAKQGVIIRGYGVLNVTGNTFKNISGNSVTAVLATVSPEILPTLQARVFDNTFQKVGSPAVNTQNTILASTVTTNLFCNVPHLNDSLIIVSQSSSIADNQFDTDGCARIVPTPENLPFTDRAIVAVPLLNLRAAASTTAAVIAKLPQETIVIVNAQQNSEWAAVSADGKNGYVNMAYLRKIGTTTDQTLSFDVVGKHFSVTVDNLNVRSTPSLDGRIVASVSRGEIVEIYAHSPVSEWLQIRTTQGVVGYVSQQYLSETQ
ncbi:SH3 domain-containing protein [Candidatus Nomurabacteria bacterium]|nr:SH3 domain-containing protein [Candidatus Nomurabacteria bacterium]